MLKKEIKKILAEMKCGEEVQFYGPERTDRISKKEDDYFGVYSFGQGWCDQITENFDFKTTLKMVWSGQPTMAA